MSEPTTDRHAPIAPRSVPPDRAAPEAQPRWRRDFPIDWSEDDYVSRRDLVKYVVLTSAAFAAGQLWLVYESIFRRRRLQAQPAAVASVDEDYRGEHERGSCLLRVIVVLDGNRFMLRLN